MEGAQFFIHELTTFQDGTLKIKVERSDFVHKTRIYFIDYFPKKQRLDVYPDGKSGKSTEKDLDALKGYFIHESLDSFIDQAHKVDMAISAAGLGFDYKQMVRSIIAELKLEIDNPEKMKPLEERDFFFVCVRENDEVVPLTLNSVGGETESVRPVMHSSNNAVHNLLSLEAITDLQGGGRPAAFVKDRIKEHLIHDIGAMLGLPILRFVDGRPVNEIDERNELLLREGADALELKKYSIADLDTNLAARDYAAGTKALFIHDFADGDSVTIGHDIVITFNGRDWSTAKFSVTSQAGTAAGKTKVECANGQSFEITGLKINVKVTFKDASPDDVELIITHSVNVPAIFRNAKIAIPKDRTMGRQRVLHEADVVHGDGYAQEDKYWNGDVTYTELVRYTLANYVANLVSAAIGGQEDDARKAISENNPSLMKIFDELASDEFDPELRAADEELDRLSSDPGVYPLEKMIFGKYLGPLVGIIIEREYRAGRLFKEHAGFLPEIFSKHDYEKSNYRGMNAENLAQIEEVWNADRTATLKIYLETHGIENPSARDAMIVRDIAHDIMKRSAQLAAATCTVDGSLLRYPGYDDMMEEALTDIFGAEAQTAASGEAAKAGGEREVSKPVAAEEELGRKIDAIIADRLGGNPEKIWDYFNPNRNQYNMKGFARYQIFLFALASTPSLRAGCTNEEVEKLAVYKGKDCNINVLASNAGNAHVYVPQKAPYIETLSSYPRAVRKITKAGLLYVLELLNRNVVEQAAADATPEIARARRLASFDNGRRTFMGDEQRNVGTRYLFDLRDEMPIEPVVGMEPAPEEYEFFEPSTPLEIINETIKFAKAAGSEIPTHPDKRYTLMPNINIYKDGDLAADENGCLINGIFVATADRLNIKPIDTSNIKNIIANIKDEDGKLIIDPARTIIQVSGDMPEADIAYLKAEAPGICIVRVDTAGFKYDSEMDKEERQKCRFDLYDMMANARRITKDDVAARNSVYMTLVTQIKAHYKDADIADSYIDALVNSDFVFIVKHSLTYRPIEQYRVPEYHTITATQMSA